MVVGRGWVEYIFPNNGLYKDKQIKKLELGKWTSPGDFGNKRGKLRPEWRKLEGSKYGLLKNWSVSDEGSFIDGVRISDLRLYFG
jgi:predicted transcriptional regulator